jgi:hypothetical protein
MRTAAVSLTRGLQQIYFGQFASIRKHNFPLRFSYKAENTLIAHTDNARATVSSQKGCNACHRATGHAFIAVQVPGELAV